MTAEITKVAMTTFYILILVSILISNASSFSIKSGDPLVKLSRRAAGYNLNMPENNHDMDTKRGLFSIDDFDASLPPHLKKDPGFNYTIEGISNNRWIFYSTSSFDYETQLRFYVFDLYVGEDFKTLTLIIENIDDEPPNFSCPEDLGMLDTQLYDASTTPCKCTVSDPDGFLNQMTFTIVKNNEFEFLRLSGLSDSEQSADVKLVNKIAFHVNEVVYKKITVVVKDGAGHNTIPDAEIDISVSVQKYMP